VCLFDPRTGTTVGTFRAAAQTAQPLSTAISFSADGRTVLIRCNQVAEVRDAEDGRRRGPPLAQEDGFLAALSPDGRLLATGGRLAVLRVWSAETGTQVGRDMVHPSWVEAIEFHPTGAHILTSGKDQPVRVWSTATGDLEAEFQASMHMVARFTPDGKAVVTATADGAVDVWDWRSNARLVPTRRLALLFDETWNDARTLELSRDGRVAVVGGRPAVHVLSLADLNPDPQWTVKELTDWAELVSHQRFLNNGPARLTGPEWLDRWLAFRGRHPAALPGESAPRPSTGGSRFPRSVPEP
jgi:WD40 repeat protein